MSNIFAEKLPIMQSVHGMKGFDKEDKMPEVCSLAFPERIYKLHSVFVSGEISLEGSFDQNSQ